MVYSWLTSRGCLVHLGGACLFSPVDVYCVNWGYTPPPYGVHLRGAFLITLACINESGDIL